MKKIVNILLKVIVGLILLIIILLFTVPIIFKKQIKTKVENVINGSLNAKVIFSDYKLGFFKNFPNLSFSLQNLYVVGINKFDKDTIAGFKSFDLVFNVGSLLGKSGYEVKSMIINEAVINAKVLKDGTANWDLMKPTGTSTASAPAATATPAPAPAPVTATQPSQEGSVKILLRKFEIKNSSINYSDLSSAMSATLKDLNFSVRGGITMSGVDIKMDLKVAETSFTMDGVKYLNKASINSMINLQADLDKMKFAFKQNYFSVNDLKLNFNGTVEMPKDKIITDLTFSTERTSFKTLLSLVPAIYISDYKDLKTTGDFALSGIAKGIYSGADNTLPDVTLNLVVNDGLISYPALPEKISNIGINVKVFANGKNLDKTVVNLDKFHMELAGSPFDMTFSLKTPISDPDFTATMHGKVDLAALSKAIPLDGIKLTGIFDMAINMAGKLSMITKEHYDRFKAEGTLGVTNILIAMAGYPEVRINNALFSFTPAYAEMQKAELLVAKTSDFSINGRFENYMPYIFRNETLKGNLVIQSRQVDATAIMAATTPVKTAVTNTKTDTTSLSVIPVPKNIDFDFTANIKKFSYDSIKAENVKAKISVKKRIFSIRDAGMDMLGGSILMSADYDTRDTLRPVMKADISIKNIGVKDAFKTFVIVQKLVPAAKGIDGKINAQLNYQSLLGKDMMPVLNTIDGSGKLQSDQITLVESPTFDKIKGFLKLGDKYSNTFKDINISFKIKDGRVFVSPFDVKLGNIKMNIGGDQGLDQTINYLVKTEIPRADLGNTVNSLIDNLSSQAAKFGISYKPAAIIKVNVKVSGTFSKPEVAPAF